MNESWWNTDNIISDDIRFSSDPMEPYHKLAKNCSSGYLTSNVFGGGTVSSEAEFLTGLNTKYFVADSGIYLEMQKRKVPSVVDYFHALGYGTTVIHPYYGSFYGRDEVYPLLGFDKVIFAEDMDYTDIYTRYISDESLAKQIIKECEEGGEKRQFIFAVSIANHVKVLEYEREAAEDYDYPIAVTVEDAAFSEKDYDKFVSYVNGIYLANQAFVQLTEYFEKAGEPTVLVMFGDHIPDFSDEVLQVMGLSGVDDADDDTLRRLYSVPVLMWSNFDAPETVFSGEGIQYLPQMLLDYAGLPDSDMACILRRMRGCFKANARAFVTDADGQRIDAYSEPQREAVNHFMVVDYDMLFGGGIDRGVWEPYGAGG